MRRIGRLTIAAAVPLLVLATAAQAQLAGIPVYYTPRGGTGVGIAANLGFPNTAAGGGTAYGLAVNFGVGPMTFTGMAGAYKGTGFSSAQASVGGNVAYRLFGGGFLPVAVAVQAGYGMVKSGIPNVATITTSTIPVGVGVGLDLPLVPFKPWIAPRIEFATQSGLVGGNASAASFRVSAGLDFNLLLGLGVHAAVDYGSRPAKLDPNPNPSQRKSANTMTIGVGAHFNFHVPMM
jgi:hypothetical protein